MLEPIGDCAPAWLEQMPDACSADMLHVHSYALHES